MDSATIPAEPKCACGLADEIARDGVTPRKHMFWCPMAPAAWVDPSRHVMTMGRLKHVVAQLTGGVPGVHDSVLVEINETHTPPADASRMGAVRPTPFGMFGIFDDGLARTSGPDDGYRGQPRPTPSPGLIIGADDVPQHDIPPLGIGPASPPWMVLVAERLRQRPGDQPLPTPSDSPPMHDLVCADVRDRKQLGLGRYGRALQAHNGRDALRDHYEELLDACAYARQLLYERDGK